MKSNKADGAWLADRRLGAQAPTSVASEGNGPDLKQPGPLRQDGSFGGSGSAPSGHAHSCKLFCRIETSSKAELIRHDQTCSIRAWMCRIAKTTQRPWTAWDRLCEVERTKAIVLFVAPDKRGTLTDNGCKRL